MGSIASKAASMIIPAGRRNRFVKMGNIKTPKITPAQAS
jgi:hypothetical protein